MSKLTPEELAYVRRTIEAIIANDMAAIDGLAKDTHYSRDSFEQVMTSAKLTPADVPGDLSRAVVVTTTGHVHDII
jgi:hypothetical protein